MGSLVWSLFRHRGVLVGGFKRISMQYNCLRSLSHRCCFRHSQCNFADPKVEVTLIINVLRAECRYTEQGSTIALPIT